MKKGIEYFNLLSEIEKENFKSCYDNCFLNAKHKHIKDRFEICLDLEYEDFGQFIRQSFTMITIFSKLDALESFCYWVNIIKKYETPSH